MKNFILLLFIGFLALTIPNTISAQIDAGSTPSWVQNLKKKGLNELDHLDFSNQYLIQGKFYNSETSKWEWAKLDLDSLNNHIVENIPKDTTGFILGDKNNTLQYLNVGTSRAEGSGAIYQFSPSLASVGWEDFSTSWWDRGTFNVYSSGVKATGRSSYNMYNEQSEQSLSGSNITFYHFGQLATRGFGKYGEIEAFLPSNTAIYGISSKAAYSGGSKFTAQLVMASRDTVNASGGTGQALFNILQGDGTLVEGAFKVYGEASSTKWSGASYSTGYAKFENGVLEEKTATELLNELGASAPQYQDNAAAVGALGANQVYRDNSGYLRVTYQ